MSTTILEHPDFEQKPWRELEQKFIPIDPDSLVDIHRQARPVEQFYLSSPEEDYSLRMREELDMDGSLYYTATLKDRGLVTSEGIDRLEVEVPINAELYQYYKEDVPIIRKLRARANNHVVVDYYEDGHVQLESDDPIAWTSFSDRFGGKFIEVTGRRIADNEQRAHDIYRLENDKPYRESIEELSALEIADQILQFDLSQKPLIVKICGRSGSGKSTLVDDMCSRLQSYGIRSEVLSTDDYHRGASWLKNYNNGQDWSEWDHPLVYDTQAAARELGLLARGMSIPRRRFNFTTAETEIIGAIDPAPVIILEGIYAGHTDLDGTEALRYNLPTSLATCVGRRLARDMKERPEFSDPAKSLAYMLAQAEPMYRANNPGAI